MACTISRNVRFGKAKRLNNMFARENEKLSATGRYGRYCAYYLFNGISVEEIR